MAGGVLSAGYSHPVFTKYRLTAIDLRLEVFKWKLNELVNLGLEVSQCRQAIVELYQAVLQRARHRDIVQGAVERSRYVRYDEAPLLHTFSFLPQVGIWYCWNCD